jgi:hypothetical protein
VTIIRSRAVRWPLRDQWGSDSAQPEALLVPWRDLAQVVGEVEYEDDLTVIYLAAMIRLFTRDVLALFIATCLVAAVASRVGAADGVSVSTPNSQQYDLTSRINGQTYRLWIATPAKLDPAVA